MAGTKTQVVIAIGGNSRMAGKAGTRMVPS